MKFIDVHRVTERNENVLSHDQDAMRMEDELSTQISEQNSARQRLVELTATLDARQAEVSKLEAQAQASNAAATETEAALAESYASIANRGA